MTKKTKSLKIGLVFDDGLDRPDGVQQYIKALGQYYIDQGHDVRYLVGETKNAGTGFDKYVYSLSKNMKVTFNKNSMTMPLPARSSKIKEVLRDEAFDILHIQVPYSPFMGGKVIKYADSNTAVIGTFHIIGDSWMENYGTRLLRLVQSRTLKRFDSFGCTSPGAQKFVAQYFNMQDTKVYSCLTDVRTFGTGRKLKSVDDGKTNILYLGRLVERKGVEHLIESLKSFSEQELSKMRVMICGDGQLRSKLEARVAELGYSDTVEFHGFIDEEKKKDYFASADISVFPATGGESFGIVLIESMATGKSVVLGGDNPGYASVLGPRPELLFDPHDHEALAQKIKRFMNNKSDRSNAIAWQLERVDEFSTERVGSFMLAEYQDALTAKQKK